MTFDRPAYLEMMAEVEAGRVSTIIVKDHSRLGRNRLVVGILLEETFAQYHVRYIAINDGVDTINGIDDSIAVRDLFNEWHARDTSKKVKAVIMAAARRGERIGTSAPYGYKKDEENPKHLVPDEQTAPVVARIFELCAGGLGPDKIARILTRLTSSHQSRAKKELAAKQRELDKGERRLKDLETLFRRSFEELALGHLSDGQFQTLVRGYEQEKVELEAKAKTLKDEIVNRQDTLLNAERFRRLVDKYTDITELTPELVREFVERIEIHERSGRYKKSTTLSRSIFTSISSARHDKTAPGCRNILGPCLEFRIHLY